MITPPKPGQALDLYMSWDDWLPAAMPWPPELHERPDPIELLSSRSLESYEFRPSSYLALRCTAPVRIDLGAEFDALRRKLAHMASYADSGIGCEMRDWEDRANADHGHPDWWDAEWVRAAWRAGLGPTEDGTGHCGGCSCDPFGDSFDCQDDCEKCDGCR